MGNHACIILFFLIILIINSTEEAHAAKGNHKRHKDVERKQLFVFGDSYADTGNWPNSSMASSWKEPYGITFPGKPTGRFSDGRVLTDYIASFLGIISPLPYQKRKAGDEKSQQHGMNFAHGGTGVFNTMVKEPNMTTQINFFQQLLQEQQMYSKNNLNSSIALVSVGGNDYATYWAKKGNLEGLPTFTKSVINQLGLNLKRIGDLGVKKVAITAMEPLGCLPQMTTPLSYQNCSEAENSLAKFHNELLQQSVSKLNNQSHDTKFIILDLYTAFLANLDIQHNHPGNTTTIENTLKPCCIGTRSESACGSTDRNGVKEYVVCANPKLSFFWDSIHPSQHGWFAVYSALKSSLHALL